jgi:hypothetical protein
MATRDSRMFRMSPLGVCCTMEITAPWVMPRFSRWVRTLGEPPTRRTVRDKPSSANVKGMMLPLFSLNSWNKTSIQSMLAHTNIRVNGCDKKRNCPSGQFLLTFYFYPSGCNFRSVKAFSPFRAARKTPPIRNQKPWKVSQERAGWGILRVVGPMAMAYREPTISPRMK